jgi:hypothetical protein
MAKDDNVRVKIKLKNVRLSYAHLFKAKKFDKDSDAPAKYQTRGIIDPDSKIGEINVNLIEDAIDDVIEAKWGKRPTKLKDDKLFAKYSDRDEEDPDMRDMYIISASNERKPLCLDRDGEDVVESDDVLYSGMYADVIVTVWAQDNKYGQRVNASLEGVKERGEGARLSGGAPIDRREFDDDDDEPKRGRGRGRDDDDEPKRGRGRGRDDEDDEPKRGRGRGRDDEDDEPKRGRGRGRDDEDDEPKRGRGRGRDDEDDEPKRGRGRDDEDDEPKRGRGRDRDDEDDEPKRGRGRGRDDEDDEPSKSSRRRRSRNEDNGI